MPVGELDTDPAPSPLFTTVNFGSRALSHCPANAMVTAVALLSIVSAAERAPVTEGLKDTEIEQVAFGDTGDPQLFVLTKSAGCSPETPIFEICNGAVPVFFTVTVFSSLIAPTIVLENERFVEVTAMAG